MSETASNHAVLSAIAELGSATLESVMIWLEPALAPMDGARGFQTAREREWIVEAEPALNHPGDPSYRLSQLGIEELGRQPGKPLRSIDGGGADLDVPVLNLVEVVADFEQLGERASSSPHGNWASIRYGSKRRGRWRSTTG